MTRTPMPRAAAAIATAAVTAAAAAGSLAATAGTVAADGARAVYVNEVLPHLSANSLLSPTPAATPVTIGVMIAHPNQAAEDSYVHDEYTPGTAAYGHWLSPAQFQQRFGVSSAALNAVTAWLRAGHLSVETIPGVSDYVLATGTASNVGSLLQVHFGQYRTTNGAVRANDRAPSAPASLNIFGFAGLDTLQGPHLNKYSPAYQPHLPAQPRPASTPAIGPNTNVGLSTPQVLWDVYDQPAVNKGEGETMAIFGWGVTDGVERDLRFEEKEFKLPGTSFHVSHYGPEQVTDVGGLGEWDLDTQSSTGMSPDTQGLKLYFGAAGTDPDIIGAYKAWVADPNGPLQGSSSFGGCEEAPGTDNLSNGGPGNPNGEIVISNANQDLYDAALKQAVAEGRTMFASTGDTGSSCPVVGVDVNGIGNEAVPLLGYPAASAYAVAVGGTILYYDGDGSPGNPATRALEYAWPYTGGGTSAFIAAPPWQASVPTIVGHCASDPHGNQYSPPAPLCRGTPDVAAQSGDFQLGTGADPNGYTITSGGSTDQPGGGTSLSSPLWLGMWTRVQAASAHGTGFAAPQIYAIGSDSTKSANDFNDIVAGANGYYQAHPGWDYVSGFGSPDVANIMKDVDNGNITPVHDTPPPQVVTSIPALPIHINPCGPLFTGQPGSDSVSPPLVGPTPVEQGMNPQLDVLAGDMALSPDGKSLITTMVIQNLNKNLPPGGQANQYYFDWAFQGRDWYSVVQVDSSGNVTFNDGETVQTNDPQGRTPGRTTRTDADPGSFGDGPNGRIVVQVPLSAVGNPKVGDVLSAPTASVQEQEGVILPTYDTAGPEYDFQLGATCSTVTTTGNVTGGVHGATTLVQNAVPGLPNTAAPAAAPLAGMVAGFGLAGLLALGRRRRRRSRGVAWD